MTLGKSWRWNYLESVRANKGFHSIESGEQRRTRLVIFGQPLADEPTNQLGDPFHDSYIPLRRAVNDASRCFVGFALIRGSCLLHGIELDDHCAHFQSRLVGLHRYSLG